MAMTLFAVDETRYVRQPLTGIALTLYLLLFIYVYIQLILVLVYGHKRWCYRTALLYASILWVSLRITLFSYYCYIEHLGIKETIPELSRHVGTTSYFLLFSLPLYLQYTIICVLVAYFAQILRTSEDRYSPSQYGHLGTCSYLVWGSNIVLLLVNLICAIVIKHGEEHHNHRSHHHHHHNHMDESYTNNVTPNMILSQFSNMVAYIVYCRVVINGILFISMSVTLAYLIVQVAQTVEVQLLLETENMTQEGSRSVGILLTILYMFRIIANVLALIPGVTWMYDTDQVDLLSDSEFGYYLFLTSIFLWEYLPTLASVVFFRVKKPSLSGYIPIPGITSPNTSGVNESPYTNPLECSMTFHYASESTPSYVSNAGDMFVPPTRSGSDSPNTQPGNRSPYFQEVFA